MPNILNRGAQSNVLLQKCWKISLLFAAVSVFGGSSPAADMLTIGSDAPALDIAHWVHDGNGKFKHVSKFEKGKVYVVEFWATWCGPCVQSMPHLAKLQTEYADKGVQLISISDEDLPTVEQFLDREVRRSKSDDPDAKTQTYRELTSVYCLTTDPDRSTAREYMEASGQGGIPTAFIVGKDSKVEWIGHPMEMDQPLAAVVADKWDRAAFLEEIKARQAAEEMFQEVGASIQRKDFEKAMTLIDQAMAKNPKDLQLKVLKLQVLVIAEKPEPAKKYAQALFTELADRPDVVSGIAWHLYESGASGKLDIKELIPDTIKATEAAIEKLEKEAKASAMDTLAHLLALTGEKGKAIEIETKALELASPQDKAFMKQFLDELKQ
jgi:thiol-disulfide isomerase/thioredoxin